MLNKQLKDFWKTKSFIDTLDARAKGWDPINHDAGLPGPFVCIYAYDSPTQWIWMCRVARDDFVNLSSCMLANPHLVESVRGSVAHVLGSAAEGTPPADVDVANWENQLGSLLTLYAGTTTTWNAANRFRTEGGHFIVLNYRRAGQFDGKLRPFAMQNCEGIIPVDQFETMVKQVIRMDETNHPEWF